MKKAMICLLTLALMSGLCLSGCGRRAVQENPDAENGFTENPEMENGGVFAGGTRTEDEPYVITAVSGLAAVRNDLTACYRLDADIDLSGVDWTPIGAFIPAGEENEAREIPVMENAFTGIFDGGSHTISHVTVNQPETVAVGLFGGIYNAHIYNLSVENASVTGCMMTGAVAGYACNSRLTAVSLTGNNSISGHDSESEKSRMIGGMAGCAKNSPIDSCSAKANVFLPDNGHYAAVLCGGLEATSVINSYTTGSVTTGDNCYGIGGIAGCALGSEEFVLCNAENLSVTVGKNEALTGGIVGCAGGYEDDSYGVKITEIRRCSASHVNIQTDENFTDINEIVGGGFRPEAPDFQGVFPDFPTVFTISDCTANVTLNGKEIPNPDENVTENLPVSEDNFENEGTDETGNANENAER